MDIFTLLYHTNTRVISLEHDLVDMLNKVRDTYQIQADNKVKDATKTLRHNVSQLQKKLASVETKYKRLYERKLKESLAELKKENRDLKKKLNKVQEVFK